MGQERDPSRLIHYERDWSCQYVDVYSRMYPTHRDLERIGRHQEPPARTGRLEHHDACPSSFANTPTPWATVPEDSPSTRSCSSAIPACRAASHGSGSTRGCARDPRRPEYFAYGGDFGEKLHDGNFVADGAALPRPHPVARRSLEMKKVLSQPLEFSLEAGGVWVENKHDHRRSITSGSNGR